MRFDNFQWPARVLAPRAIGSCKSPSPAKMYVNLFNDELDIMGSNNQNRSFSDSNTQILSQIEKLADLRDRGIITEAEFSDKKSILLDKIQ